MTNTRDVILKLKEVKEEKGLSLDKILILMEKSVNICLNLLFQEYSLKDQKTSHSGTKKLCDLSLMLCLI